MQEFNKHAFQVHGVEGISIEFLEKEITQFPNSMKRILQGTDILIDATKRSQSTMIIIPNEWLAYLPEHAIILDLTADPYEVRGDDIQQKAIEGIPHGNIDKYIFRADDRDWAKGIPTSVNTTNRRNTISCNAWPSVMANECMDVYGKKIWPFLQLILKKGFELKIESSDQYERAIGRATIDYFERSKASSEERTKEFSKVLKED
jgi:alanine dehydrogenase